jgi:hypothetical protein
MENLQMKRTSPYAGCCIILTTNHAKSIAAAPPFWNRLSAGMLEYGLNTDVPGAFPGHAGPEGSTCDRARRKCEWGLETLRVEYALASEGSFGLHPRIPFLPWCHEALHFIDRKRGFHLSVSHRGRDTNYQSRVVDAPEALARFAAEAKFPSHALILRPNDPVDSADVFAGIVTQGELEAAFRESLSRSKDGRVWVQTDMRAHMNPSRMTVIGELADALARRLATPCPACGAPGWGSIRGESADTGDAFAEPPRSVCRAVFGCVLCPHTEAVPCVGTLSAAPCTP